MTNSSSMPNSRSAEQVAETLSHLGITKRQIEVACKSGALQHVSFFGDCVEIADDALVRWLLLRALRNPPDGRSICACSSFSPGLGAS